GGVGSRYVSEPVPGSTDERRPPPYAATMLPGEHQTRSSALSFAAAPAASIRRLAKRAITALRSACVIPSSLVGSSDTDSWRAVEWRSGLADIIVLLTGDIRVVRGVSAESECNQ